MLALAKRFRRNGEGSIADNRRGAAVVSHFNTGYIRLTASQHFDLCIAAHCLLGGQALKRHRRRQRGHLKADGFRAFSPHLIHRPNVNRRAARRKIGGIQVKFKLTAAALNGWLGIQAQAGNRRLSHSRHAAGQTVLQRRLRCKTIDINLNARRQHGGGEWTVNGRALAAGIAGANSQSVFARAEVEWLQAEIIGRLAVDFDGALVNDEFNGGDLGLAAGADRNQFGFGQWNVLRRKIGRQSRGQSRHFKISLIPAGVAIDVANRNIKRIIARRQAGWVNDKALINRDKFPIQRVSDVSDVLIRPDLNLHLGAVHQRIVEQIRRQGQQRYRNRRPQNSPVRCRLPLACADIQRKAVTSAIGGHRRV